METVKNPYYIPVRRCCASCRHRFIRKDGIRVCLPMELIVKAKFRCPKWEMREGLRRAGKSLTP